MKALTALNVVVTTQNELYKTDAKKLIIVIQDVIYERIIELEKYGITLITTPDEAWFCEDEYNKDGSSTLKYIEPKYIRVTDDMITQRSKVDAIYAPDKPTRILRKVLVEAFEKIEREVFSSIVSDITEENELISECKRLDHLVVNLVSDPNLLPLNAAYPVSNKYQFTISDKNVHKDLDPSACSFFNYFIGKVEYNLDTNELVVYNQVSYFNPHMLIYKLASKPVMTKLDLPRVEDLEAFWHGTYPSFTKDTTCHCIKDYKGMCKHKDEIIFGADRPNDTKQDLNDKYQYHTILHLKHSFITDESITLYIKDVEHIMYECSMSLHRCMSFDDIISFDIDEKYLTLNYKNQMKFVLPIKLFCRYAYNFTFKWHLRILGKIFGKSFKSVELM